MIRSASFPADRRHVAALLEEVEAHGGGPALSEELRWDLEHGRCAGPNVVAVAGGSLIGYAHLMGHREHLLAEMAIAPGDRRSLAPRMVAAILEAGGDRPVRFRSADPGAVSAAVQAGMVATRSLLRLEAPLPITAVAPGRPDPAVITRFRGGADEDAFLLVSNEAFADHPDSGGWDRAVLRERMARPWFDPAGLFLAWGPTEPVGVCWTKRHPGGIGEIYSVAVRPRWSGRGLGRLLVTVGLRYLAEERGAATGLIYVEEGNLPAVALYRSMGFDEAGRTEELVIGAAPRFGS